MALKEQLQKLVAEKNSPCVTISLDTHRTHPDNAKDEILLKNLCLFGKSMDLNLWISQS